MDATTSINSVTYAGIGINGGGTVPDPLTLNQINVVTISDVSTVNGLPYVPGGGGSAAISQWSLCGAVSTISANSHNITGVLGLSAQNITVCNVNGVPYVPNIAGNVSQWSLCGAVSTISANSHNITGVLGLSAQNIMVANDLYVDGTAYIRQEYIRQTLYVSDNVITNYANISSNLYVVGNTTISGLTTILNLSYAGFTDLSAYTYTSISNVSGRVFSLSGTVSNLSGYTYTSISNVSSGVYSLSGTVSNLSGYTYTSISNVSSGVYSLSGTVSNLSGYTYTSISNVSGGVNDLSGYSRNNITTICGILTGYSTSFTTITLSVCGLATLSGLTVNNNATVSNLLTTSGLTVNVSAQVGGLRVNNNALVAGTLTVSTNLVVSNLFTTSGLTVNRNATVSNLLTTSGLTVNNNATFSALITTERLQVNSNALIINNLTVCGAATISGLTVNRDATISNLLTTSGLTVNVSAQVGGLRVNNNALIVGNLTVSTNLVVSNLFTTSGLTVNNNAQITSNLSVGTINGLEYSALGYGIGTGILRVDVNGNDISGALNKYVYPFQTISAALSNAVSGNEVFVSPGTYNQSSTLVIPTGVSLRGANTNSVFIQNVGATNSFTLVEMRSNTRIEDVTLTLTSTTATNIGAEYVAVAISGANIPSIKLRTMVMNVNNFNPGGNPYGIYATGNANTDLSLPVSATTVRGSTINVNTSGQTQGSNAHCIYSSGSNRVSIRDTNCFLVGTNCSGARLTGCETTISGSYMDLQSSAISARSSGTISNCSLGDISQTHPNSVIDLGGTHLLQHSANGLGFSTIQLGTNFIYGVYDTTAWSSADFNKTGYMFPGTTIRSAVAATSTTDAFPYTTPQDCILTRVLFRVNPTAVLGTNGSPILYTKIFLNEDFATPIVTLSLTGTTRVAKNFNFSKTLLEGDRVYVNISGSGAGGGASSVTDLYSATVDFELF